MTGTVITITSGKGGVGKTTTTASLAVALARMGKKVVCIDADIGLRNLDAALGIEDDISTDLLDVVEGRARLVYALVADVRLPNLMLLPASKGRSRNLLNEFHMTKICQELRSSFDFILIDCPAGIEKGFRNAITPADQILVVVTAEVSSVRDADRVVGLLEGIGKPSPYLIINRFQPSMSKKGELMDISSILDILAIELIGVVPEDEKAIAAGTKGVPLTWRLNSPAAVAFNQIAHRLLGEDIPLKDLLPQVGILQRMTRLLGIN